VGAPWMDAKIFAKHLNKQGLPGVQFQPFHFRPFFGRHAKEECHGVRIVVTEPNKYRPVSTQFVILGLVKSLYPTHFLKGIKDRSKQQERMFSLLTGSKEIEKIMKNERYVGWKLAGFHEKERAAFMRKRKKFLLPQYSYTLR
jgi:uncharacterized protein YbbC (DUF1343 family)